MQIDNGLEIKFELPMPERIAQFGLGAMTRLHTRVELLLVEGVRPSPQLLHAAHGKRCILDELVGGISVIGTERDADAGAELQALAASEEGLADEIDDLPGPRGHLLIPEVTDLNEREFVAADTRHRIVVLDHTVEARGDDPQQLVARRIAQHLVDGLEPIETYILDGDALAGLGYDGHRLAHTLLEASAVRQTRQRIGKRLLIGVRSRLLVLQGDGA